MRLVFLLFFLVSVMAWGQNASDSLANEEQLPEWSTKDYSQEDKIFNRSVWTFVDNPALAGFDWKLAAAYRFRMKNLSMGVPNDKGNLELAFMKHEAFIDLSTGGPKQNWGTAIYYSNEKELLHSIQHIVSASSFRINIKKHHLIFGAKATVQFTKLEDWERFTFPDMIEPRHGFIYQSQEIKPNYTFIFVYFGWGLRYYWKRFSFDYSFEHKPTSGFEFVGAPHPLNIHRLKTNYHFNVGDGVSISPEFVAQIISDRNHIGLFSGYVTITYKDMAYGQLGIADNNRLSFRAGYQLKDMLVIEAGMSSYLDKTMEKIGGMASVDVGIRYQIRPWYR